MVEEKLVERTEDNEHVEESSNNDDEEDEDSRIK